MSRFITAFAFALGCTALTVHAQDTTTKTTTKSSGGDVKTVTYTGCVHSTQSRSYVLDKVVPTSKTTTIDAEGNTSTSTAYMLVPGERVEVQQLVGHKVEVTGMLVPAGKVKTETTTKTDRDDAKDTKTREKTTTETDLPQFRVTSIKSLAESCN